jgi:hypothetical protein
LKLHNNNGGFQRIFLPDTSKNENGRFHFQSQRRDRQRKKSYSFANNLLARRMLALVQHHDTDFLQFAVLRLDFWIMSVK